MDALLTIDGDADIQIQRGDIVTTGGLSNSMYISLFTPDFWGNSIVPTQERLDSTIPALMHRELTNQTRIDIEKSARRALQWMIDLGIASSLIISAVITNPQTVVLSIQTTEPATETVYRINWSEQRNEL